MRFIDAKKWADGLLPPPGPAFIHRKDLEPDWFSGAVHLPPNEAKCKGCSGPLRVTKTGAGDYWLICDECERCAIAPKALHTLIDDMLGRAAELLRAAAYAGDPRVRS